jgi:hypothetical protein
MLKPLVGDYEVFFARFSANSEFGGEGDLVEATMEGYLAELDVAIGEFYGFYGGHGARVNVLAIGLSLAEDQQGANQEEQ